MAKRGPGTARGKAATSRNALKHGQTSSAPVIPGKSPGEWQGHPWAASWTAFSRGIRHGRRRAVRLEEVPVEQRAPVLKAYLKWALGARPLRGEPQGAVGGVRRDRSAAPGVPHSRSICLIGRSRVACCPGPPRIAPRGSRGKSRLCHPQVGATELLSALGCARGCVRVGPRGTRSRACARGSGAHGTMPSHAP